MDHLTRSPLLLEFALPSRQRLKPGGARKDRTRRHARTSASMPHARGEGNIVRRIADKRRLHQARDRRPSFSKRKAQRDYKARRPKATHGHLAKKRKNPLSKTKLEKRGNPQAKSKTQVRVSPSKQERRPTLPRTPQFFDRGSLMKGSRL